MARPGSCAPLCGLPAGAQPALAVALGTAAAYALCARGACARRVTRVGVRAVAAALAYVLHAAAVLAAVVVVPGRQAWRRWRKRAEEGQGVFAALMVPGWRDAGVRRRKKTLVLDLDETLVHSRRKACMHYDMRLAVEDAAAGSVFYVAKRPYLDVFLRTAAMWYDVVIYTASLQKYADPLISALDPDGLVQRRLFRPSCRRHDGNFVKDLQLVEPDLRDVIILDNSPAAYALHAANAVPVEPWYDDRNDEELLNLLPLLHAVAFLEDVRSLLNLRLTAGTLSAKHPRPPARTP